MKLTRGFWLGKYEVTQAEYRAIVKTNPSHFSAAGLGKDAVVGLNTDKFPVEMVSWDQAAEFCRVFSEQERHAGRLPEGWEYRLPTEAQWEYGCWADTRTTSSVGEVISRFDEFAWHASNSDNRAHEVGQKKSNAWGLHDMHGNVVEWCRDWYETKLPRGSDPEIVQPTSSRVIRGGSWRVFGKNCLNRGGDLFQGNSVGFRLAVVQLGR